MRTAIAIVAIAFCLLSIRVAARFGYSRLLTRYANLSGSLPAADEAVRLAPEDAESHYIRAAVLRYLDQLPGAASEYEMAVRLRPLDDLLWSELGSLREELNDSESALSALNESVRTAPFYAMPRWQRGNLLLRMRRYDEGFADLRQAATSDHELQPSLIDLAWGLSKGNLKLTEQVLQITDPKMRLSYARFLARKGLGEAALEQIRAVGLIPDQIRKEMVSHLIARESFKPAFQIWSNSNSHSINTSSPIIFDGDFEGRLSFDESGFGWRMARGDAGVVLSVDQYEKQSGMRSLRIQFKGDPSPGMPIVSQLILIEPLRRYRVNFASRTQDIITGGLPIVIISNPTDDQILGKAEPIREGTKGWNMESFEFRTGAEVNAVRVSLKRQNCATTPCPIFGVLWLDGFSIEGLNVLVK